MSSVLYTCTQGCRLFAEPGGTRLRCHQHDERFKQQEDASGLDVIFVDEQQIKHIPNPDEHAAATLPADEAKEYLRLRYQKLTGEIPDGRLGVDSLLEMVQNASPPLSIDTAEPEGDQA